MKDFQAIFLRFPLLVIAIFGFCSVQMVNDTPQSPTLSPMATTLQSVQSSDCCFKADKPFSKQNFDLIKNRRQWKKATEGSQLFSDWRVDKRRHIKFNSLFNFHTIRCELFLSLFLLSLSHVCLLPLSLLLIALSPWRKYGVILLLAVAGKDKENW